MAEWTREYRVDIWAYCLMPNHVHLIAAAKSEDGLRRAFRRGAPALYAAR